MRRPAISSARSGRPLLRRKAPAAMMRPPPATGATLMIEPWRGSSRRPANAWHTYMAESRFSRINLSQPDNRRSRNPTMKFDPPALLTTRPRVPADRSRRRPHRPGLRPTATALPIARDAPVTKAVLPVRSKRLTVILPFGRQRPGDTIDAPHDLAQHNTDVTLAHPEVLGPLHGDDLSLRHPRQPGPCLVRTDRKS